MLTLNDSLAVDIGQEIATRILSTFHKLMSKPTTPAKREVAWLSEHALTV